MKKIPMLLSLLLIISACSTAAAGPFPSPETEQPSTQSQAEAILAGGCFWGVEAVFEELKGVLSVESGYAGGSAQDAIYETVGSGNTGHAEAVRIRYDPRVITYGTLLKVFFSVAHDPTQLNYQGPDQGPHYRTAVFPTTEAQKALVERYIGTLNKSGAFPRPIVTTVEMGKDFYPAEEYHQDFMRLHPGHPYIEHWDRPKLEDLKKKYKELLK